MAVWKGVQIAISTIACVVGAIGWGLFIVGFAVRLNDATYAAEDVLRCTRGAGSVLENIGPMNRTLQVFADFEFFAWWAIVVTGPILIIILIVNQLVVSFHQRIITIGVSIFFTLFVAIFYFGMVAIVMDHAAQLFRCSFPGHIRYAGEHYFVTLEFAGACISSIFLGLALFFQTLLALCRFKKDVDYEVGCGWGLCSCGIVIEEAGGREK